MAPGIKFWQALDMGAKKIVNLANGTLADDAATFGQIPTALPPSGSAGGDLTGTYPNPTLGSGAFGTPAVALGTAAVAGSATDAVRTDATIVAFDATAPSTQAFGDSAVVGTAAVAARRDHKHAMMAAPTTVSGNAGTATALQTGRTIDGVTFDGTANITVIAPGTHAATGKTTPADADELPLVDSAASNVLKKLTWANLKATLKTYFDTLYTAIGASAPPNGSAGGDLTGTYPNPTLAAAGPGATGPLGGATVAPIVTIDAKGRVTALSSATISAPGALARSARSSNTILAAADKGTVICATAAFTQTFTAAATLGAGWWCVVKNDTQDGTTVLVLDPNASETIDGLTTATMYSGETRLVECDGSNFTSQLLEGGYAKFVPSGGNFIVPAGLTFADVVCIGPGGQGGGGCSSVLTAKSGGGSGGGGAVSRALLRPGDLGAAGATVTVTVGAGGTGSGTGGAAGAGANGNNGADGSAATSFGSLLKAGAGGGGIGGQSGAAASGGGGGSVVNSGATSTAGAPASSSAIGGQGASPAGAGGAGTQAEWGGAAGGGGVNQAAGSAGGSSIYGGPGGGGGGGVTAANAGRNGGAGGSNQSVTAGSGGTAGSTSGPTAGGTGVATPKPYCGLGGGGGGAGAGVAGKDGGPGGIGGGGGGGGCSSHATSSAAGATGGDGGPGECRVWYG